MQLILKSKTNDLHINVNGEHASELLSIKALCEMLGCSYPAVKQRIYRGQSVDDAISSVLKKTD